VNGELAQKTDCVDEDIARQMAMGALKLFHSDYALATCGYAERTPGNPYAFYAIANAQAGVLHSDRIELNGSRIEVQQAVAKMVLEKLLELLRNKAGDI
jgi:nicotinamide mononucleotide (NMN) deamidase PncC